MGKRVKIALAVLAVTLVGMIVWQVRQVRQQREPVYQGKPLSEWLLRDNRRTGEAHKDAIAAVLQAGTNAIPTLLRMLRAKDSALKVRLMDLTQRQHIVKIEFTRAEDWNGAAVLGFSALGTNAQSAVPALIEIVDQNISRGSQYGAILALAFIGPAAREAVPSLLEWTTNADEGVRYYAIGVLRQIEAEVAANAWITNSPRTFILP
jgi:HEAT repeat protein